jgi:hypothetical protein
MKRDTPDSPVGQEVEDLPDELTDAADTDDGKLARFGDRRRLRRRRRKRRPDTTAADTTTKGNTVHMLDIAKAVVGGAPAGDITKRDFFEAIVEMGEEIRKTSAAAGNPDL